MRHDWVSRQQRVTVLVVLLMKSELASESWQWSELKLTFQTYLIVWITSCRIGIRLLVDIIIIKLVAIFIIALWVTTYDVPFVTGMLDLLVDFLSAGLDSPSVDHLRQDVPACKLLDHWAYLIVPHEHIVPYV